ncbi:hypothetical protein KEM52_002166 [Ascosphaera acerosa]|nr:hypothetical protein KEM52_002166 [Ascosphaera acerosa]
MISKHRRVNVERIRRITYLHEFDRELQGPVWGYPTETAYYRDATSTDSIFAMKIPFLVIHAEDDPISQKECLPYGEVQATPYGVMCTSSWGGHLGWFHDLSIGIDTPRSAIRVALPARQVVNYLTTLVSEIDLDAPVGVPAADADAADSVAAVDRPLPDVPAPGTAIVGTKASVAASGAEPHDGPVMTYEPMRRKLAMPHLAGREYS